MEFKGTKGKWKAVNCGKHWNNKEIDNIEIQYGNDGECISDHVYCKYDALLISKAPEMLEMLAILRNDYGNYTQNILQDSHRLNRINEIDELIKQATDL